MGLMKMPTYAGGGHIKCESGSIPIAGVTSTTSPLGFTPNKVFSYCNDGSNYQSCALDTTNNIKVMGGGGTGGTAVSGNSDYIMFSVLQTGSYLFDNISLDGVTGTLYSSEYTELQSGTSFEYELVAGSTYYLEFSLGGTGQYESVVLRNN